MTTLRMLVVALMVAGVSSTDTCEAKYTALSEGIATSDCDAACTDCKPLVDAMCSTCTWGDVTNAAAGEDPEGTFDDATILALSTMMDNCDFAACPTNPNANTCEGKYTTLAQGIVASDCGAACTECKPLVDAMCSTCKWGDVMSAATGEDPEAKFGEGTTMGLGIMMDNCDFAACPSGADPIAIGLAVPLVLLLSVVMQ